MKHVAPLRDSVTFEKAFSQPDIFIAFAKAMLGIDLHIDHVETNKTLANPLGEGTSHFNLYAKDKNKPMVVIIQQQHESDGNHYRHFLQAHCVASLEQLENTSTLWNIDKLQLYTLVVLTTGDRHKEDILTIDCEPKDRQGERVGDSCHKVLYVCPPYVSEDTPEPQREWLRAIHDSLDEHVDETQYQNAAIQKVFDLISKDTQNSAEK